MIQQTLTCAKVTITRIRNFVKHDTYVSIWKEMYQTLDAQRRQLALDPNEQRMLEDYWDQHYASNHSTQRELIDMGFSN
jgi:hypothetical protein